MRVLVTGGTGYIGSHTVVQLVQAGHEVDVVDNLSNSSAHALARVSAIVGRDVPLHRVDLLETAALRALLERTRPQAVVHLAGLKAVAESVAQPVRYYRNNVSGTLELLGAMEAVGCRTLVFSSSATVYGPLDAVPAGEDAPLRPSNPYGRTKLTVEQLLTDTATADDRWRVALLRYFNPVGAHVSGTIGEDPRGIPNNLLPLVSQVAIGRRAELAVWGDDWPTPDGTGVRDYVHVDDLAAGHLAALEHLRDQAGCRAWNLGTGQGSSVLEVVAAFEQASGRAVPYRIRERRPGDVAVSVADPARAAAELGWRATRTLADMCADSWRWQRANPHGYPA